MKDGAGRTRVLLADGQLLYREGLRSLMSLWPEFHVAGEAASGDEAVDFCRREHPDLVLMDVQMPGMGGVDAAAAIGRISPKTAVVVLTVVLDDEPLFAALANGVRGYLLKDIPARQLRNRLQGVVSGEAALSGAVASKVLQEFNRRGRGSEVRIPPAVHLGEREVGVLRLVAQGLSNEEIGERLFVSTGR